MKPVAPDVARTAEVYPVGGGGPRPGAPAGYCWASVLRIQPGRCLPRSASASRLKRPAPAIAIARQPAPSSSTELVAAVLREEALAVKQERHAELGRRRSSAGHPEEHASPPVEVFAVNPAGRYTGIPELGLEAAQHPVGPAHEHGQPAWVATGSGQDLIGRQTPLSAASR